MRYNNHKSFSKAVIYHTVASDLSDLSDVKYDDCIAFQSVGHQLSLQPIFRLLCGTRSPPR
jgi:hypothetical protein